MQESDTIANDRKLTKRDYNYSGYERTEFDTNYLHLDANSLLNPSQSGFHPGDSTVSQLLSIVNSIFQAVDCNPTLDVRAV